MDSVSPKARAARFLKVFDWPSMEGQSSQDPLQYWQARVLHSLFLTLVILGFFAVVPSIWLSIKEGLYGVAVFDAGVYCFVVFLFFRKTIPYAVRAATITIVIYLVGLILFFTFGLSGAGPVWLFAFPIITGVLLGYRAALIALSINGATLILVGVFLFKGALSWEYPVINPVAKWVVIFFNFMLLNALATVSLTAMLKGLQGALRQEKLLGISLQQKHTELDRSNRDLQKECTEKEVVLRELKESDRKVLLLAENALDCIWQMDRDLRITYVNPAVTTIFGFTLEEWAGTRLTDHCPLDEKENVLKAMRDELHKDGDQLGLLLETRLLHKDGREVPVEILTKQLIETDGRVVGLQGTTRDISERKSEERHRSELEAQVRRAQKLQSIGTLAGGIAHDFNNILASVIGYTELALSEVQKGTDLEDDLKEVYRAGLRAKELVKQILAFSRQGEQEKKPLQVGLIAKEVVKLIRSAIPTTIDITNPVTSTSLIMADPTQIHQVFMNLCTNAAHAMEEKGGTLDVAVSDIKLDESFTQSYPDLEPGYYLKVSVSDTGSGIDPSVIGSIFEPYFTTKGPGKGTGLGLSVAHGIIKAHHGEITVESEPAKGSTFTVYLPILKQRVEEEPEVVEKIPTGKENVLLVDDEAPIAQMGRQMLERLGYAVTVSTSSDEALGLFKSNPDAFDLVITDMNMPKMAGDSLSKELLALRPNVPIIICTGYSKRVSKENASEIGVRGFIMKPYVKSQLAKTVRTVLDQT